jgi:hypothetical protein
MSFRFKKNNGGHFRKKEKKKKVFLQKQKHFFLSRSAFIPGNASASYIKRYELEYLFSRQLCIDGNKRNHLFTAMNNETVKVWNFFRL